MITNTPIRIIIASRPSQGKSTIAVLIEDALRKAGFEDVTLVDDEMTPKALAKLRDDVAARAKHIAERKPNIVIHTKQLARNSKLVEVVSLRRVTVDAQGNLIEEVDLK